MREGKMWSSKQYMTILEYFSIQAGRVDLVQLMLNAKENNLKTTDFEINADDDAQHENIKETNSDCTSSKGMTMQVIIIALFFCT